MTHGQHEDELEWTRHDVRVAASVFSVYMLAVCIVVVRFPTPVFDAFDVVGGMIATMAIALGFFNLAWRYEIYRSCLNRNKGG